MAKITIGPPETWRQRLDRVVSEAIANGTQTAAPKLNVCHGCRQLRVWFHRSLDGEFFCFSCSPKSEQEKAVCR